VRWSLVRCFCISGLSIQFVESRALHRSRWRYETRHRHRHAVVGDRRSSASVSLTTSQFKNSRGDPTFCQPWSAPPKSRPPMSHRKSDLGIPCTRKSAKVVLDPVHTALPFGGGGAGRSSESLPPLRLGPEFQDWVPIPVWCWVPVWQVANPSPSGFLASFSATWAQVRNSMPRHNSVANTGSWYRRCRNYGGKP
jgi:hypothetical protein